MGLEISLPLDNIAVVRFDSDAFLGFGSANASNYVKYYEGMKIYICNFVVFP